jgi:hypothetical protein
MDLTRSELELQLAKNNMSPFLAIGLIVGNILLKNKNCLVGFNVLNRLQIEDTEIGLKIPIELKEKSLEEKIKLLLDQNLSEEDIIAKLKLIESMS